MKQWVPYTNGRRFLIRLAHQRDLIQSIEELCRKASIQTATFSIIGAASSITIGAYDQRQQVYVTFNKNEPYEIASCTGNVTLKNGNPIVHAHAILSDEQGKTLGGHLFSETLIFAAEIDIQELTGPPLQRTYDDITGLYLWKPPSE